LVCRWRRTHLHFGWPKHTAPELVALFDHLKHLPRISRNGEEDLMTMRIERLSHGRHPPQSQGFHLLHQTLLDGGDSLHPLMIVQVRRQVLKGTLEMVESGEDRPEELCQCHVTKFRRLLA